MMQTIFQDALWCSQTRAGRSGIVTSLYTEANRDLVRAVRQAEELAQPVVRHFCPFSPFWNATIFSPENAYIY